MQMWFGLYCCGWLFVLLRLAVCYVLLLVSHTLRHMLVALHKGTRQPALRQLLGKMGHGIQLNNLYNLIFKATCLTFASKRLKGKTDFFNGLKAIIHIFEF
ncbi:unnamed protein product [Amaranthus hypochondriacus]